MSEGALPDLPPAFTLVALEHADSAGAEAARRAAAGAAEGTLVWTRRQDPGPDVDGVVRAAPPGNLYCALVARPDYPNAEAAQLALVAVLAAGGALAGVLEAMTGLRYRWPATVLVNDLPAARVGLRAPARGDPLEWLVVELTAKVEQPPEDPDFPTFNSVAASGTAGAGVEALLAAYARWLLAWSDRWARDGFAPLRRAWLLRAEGIGERCALATADGELRGIARDLDEHGSLCLELEGGGERRVGLAEHFALP